MKTKRATICYNPEFEASRTTRLRWVEHVSDGLRLVGFADEVSEYIKHRGWFIDEDIQDEVYRGVIYQLPARDGQEQFVSGYADPFNDDCACLDFRSVGPDKEEAARTADHIAEFMAERERDYQRESSAGLRFYELGEEVKSTRTETITLIREKREAGRLSPAIRSAVVETVRRNVAAIKSARSERSGLESDYGWSEVFKEHVTGG